MFVLTLSPLPPIPLPGSVCSAMAAMLIYDDVTGSGVVYFRLPVQQEQWNSLLTGNWVARKHSRLVVVGSSLSGSYLIRLSNWCLRVTLAATGRAFSRNQMTETASYPGNMAARFDPDALLLVFADDNNCLIGF